MGRVTLDNVHDVCQYHSPDEDAQRRHANINAGAEAFIRIILENTPECADQTAAIRTVRIARGEANSAIALKGLI